MKAGLATAGAYWFLPPAVQAGQTAPGSEAGRGTARFTIFVMLEGGPSHVDSWDLKEHAWTPQDFEIRELQPGLKWPMALYPKLAAQQHRFALVRSMEARDAVHARAGYHLQSGHLLDPAKADEIPAIGSVVAYETQRQRRQGDLLPAYVATNVAAGHGLVQAGFLPAAHAPFYAASQTGRDAFSVDAADSIRYGSSTLGDGCIVARNLVEADQGARFLFVNHAGWDHHGEIYASATDRTRGNHQRMSQQLDHALSALLADLAARKRADGTSLLDETLVVAMGEFGRTPGPLNNMGGRDHHRHAFTALFAGAGVQGGQVIGKTDELGFHVVESGWGAQRNIHVEDVAATIYSAMGIDASKSIAAGAGTRFHYVAPVAHARIIEPLFG